MKESQPHHPLFEELLLVEVRSVAHELHVAHTVLTTGLDWLRLQSSFATKQDLQEMEKRIMSKISDFATAQTAFQDRIDAAVTDLQGDIKNLADQITALQNSAGEITPEDQALLDGIQSRTGTVADKLDALAAQTPPAVPTV